MKTFDSTISLSLSECKMQVSGAFLTRLFHFNHERLFLVNFVPQSFEKLVLVFDLPLESYFPSQSFHTVYFYMVLFDGIEILCELKVKLFESDLVSVTVMLVTRCPMF